MFYFFLAILFKINKLIIILNMTNKGNKNRLGKFSETFSRLEFNRREYVCNRRCSEGWQFP